MAAARSQPRRDLARIYGASDDERADLEDLVTRARVRMWWHEPEKEKEKVFSNEFAGFENHAARISVYMPLVIPGLLQTPAYIAALLELGPREPAWPSGRLPPGCAASGILDRADGTAPRLVAVITEASLMYLWGTQHDRRAKAGRLATWPAVPAPSCGCCGSPWPTPE